MTLKGTWRAVAVVVAVVIAPTSSFAQSGKSKTPKPFAVWTEGSVESTPRAGAVSNNLVQERPFGAECPVAELRGFQWLVIGLSSGGYAMTLAPVCASGFVPSFGSEVLRKKAAGHALPWVAFDPILPPQATVCPAGYGMVGLSGRFGAQAPFHLPFLVSAKLHCRSFANPSETLETEPMEPFMYSMFPNSSDTTFAVQCSSDRLATGVFGTAEVMSVLPNTPSNGRVASIGLTCQ